MKTKSQSRSLMRITALPFLLVILLAFSLLGTSRTMSVSYAKYVSEEEAGEFTLTVRHAHAILTDGYKLRQALATGTTTSGAKTHDQSIAADTSLTEVYFGTPEEYASQIAGKTGVDVSYYGDGSITLYKNGTKAYIVSDRAIATSADFGSVFEKFTNLTKVHFSSDFDTSRATSFSYLFYYAKNVASIENINVFNTSNCTTMQSMFYLNPDAPSSSPNTALKSLDVSGFDTSKVTDMGSMFRTCAGLTSLDVSGFETGKVKDMGGMFDRCTGLTSIDLTNFDTSSVTTTEIMFANTNFTTLDLRSFTCESLTKMNQMFEGCSKLKTIYADYGFDCRANSDPAATDEKDANGNYKIDPNFANIFKGCTSLVGGSGTKYDAKVLHNLYAVVDVRLAVEQTVFKSSVGYFTHYSISNPGSTSLKTGQNVNAVLKTLANGSAKDYTFQDTAVKKIVFGKLGNYNVSGLKSAVIDSTDSGSIKAYWDPASGTAYVLSDSTICFSTSSDYMFDNFRGVTSIQFDNISTSAMRTMQRMFSYCLKLTDLDLSLFETHNVVDYGSCFRDAAFNTATANNKIIPYLDTSKARDIGGLFMYCANLTGTLDLSSLSTAKAETIASLVQGCTGLSAVDISGFTNGAITNCSSMFSGCTNLTTIYASPSFNLSGAQLTTSGDMFTNCTKLVGGNGTKYAAANNTKTYARADVPGSPGYFTAPAMMFMMSRMEYLPENGVVSESDVVTPSSVTEAATTAAAPAPTTAAVTAAPTTAAATVPTATAAPTTVTTTVPATTAPTNAPTTAATTVPTAVPTTVQTTAPTTAATTAPTTAPTTVATTAPTTAPTVPTE